MTTALCALLPADLHLGDPFTAGSLTVYPVLGTQGGLEYVSFAEAAARGASVTELPNASVNDLLVHNPLDLPLLLYGGEEVRGARQDRKLDFSVLVGPGGKTRVPVSCVEHGRWDPKRQQERFQPSPRAAYPSLRAMSSQQAVWEDLAAMADALDAPAPTGAMRDIYGEREIVVPRHDGQLGALACYGPKPAVLDYVSRPDVWAALHGPLTAGYGLEALRRPANGTPDPAEFFATVTVRTAHEAPASGGLGRSLRFQGGTALAVEDEVVALTAFA